MPFDINACRWLPDEAQHDFIKPRTGSVPILRPDQISNNFRTILRLNRATDCNSTIGIPDFSPTYSAKKNFYTDDKIVERVFGLKKQYLYKTYNPTLAPNFTVNVRDNNTKRCRFSNCNYTVPIDLFNLFYDSTTVEANIQHIFIIIDKDAVAAINLLKLIPLNTHGIQAEINIHVLHSNMTLADSADKPSPDAKSWSETPILVNNIKIWSWYYDQQITVSRDDPIFMSNYDVTTFLTQVPPNNYRVGHSKWETYQSWNLPGQPGQPAPAGVIIRDCENSNNVKNTSIIFASNASNDRKNLALHEKLSGDYFQMWFAKNFPKNIANYLQKNSNGTAPTLNDFKDTDFKLKGKSSNIPNIPGQAPAPFPTPLLPVAGVAIDDPTRNAIEKWYKDRTYFMSGDWPATSGSVYNEINTYFGITSKTLFFRTIIRD